MIVCENELLIVRAKRKKAWQPPGGKVEGSESTLQCIRREVRQETGLDLTTANFQLCLEPSYQKNMKSDVYFCTVLAKPAAKPRPFSIQLIGRVLDFL